MSSPRALALLVGFTAASAGAACSGAGLELAAPTAAAGADGGASAVVDASDDAHADSSALGPDGFDLPIDGLSDDELAVFEKGDALFDVPLRESDGLGPVYVRSSCAACHNEGVRGPGSVTKMAVVEADGITPAKDQSLLAFGVTVRPLVAGGGKSPILPPKDASVRVTLRFGPSILGRGYMEAVADSELLRVAAEQAGRGDGIHGRVNHVLYASLQNSDTRFHTHGRGDTVIGRFGLKARIATLDDFTADALQGDMGLTSPLRPTEVDNPDGLDDDSKPGVDMTIDSVNVRADYVRTTAIPRRTPGEAGERLFAQAKCAVCHAPSLRTRGDYPIAVLRDIDAPVYTDMLVHDMGDALADGVVEGEASSRDWRTAPLIGLRFNRTYLHDGRARSIAEAIVAHDSAGSEARASIEAYGALTPADRATLVAFVEAL